MMPAEGFRASSIMLLNRFRTILADEALNLPDNLTLRRLLPEH